MFCEKMGRRGGGGKEIPDKTCLRRTMAMYCQKALTSLLYKHLHSHSLLQAHTLSLPPA